MENDNRRRHVVSVSIGDSERDHCVETDILGVPFKMERIGTNGDMAKACTMISELDGNVDAIGLGGTDLYVYIGSKRYTMRSSLQMLRSAKKTPVYDGSILKLSIEKEIVCQLCNEGKYLSPKSNVLLVSSVDRFGMADAFHDCRCSTIFADLMFSLGLPIPVRSISGLKFLASILIPVVSQLPIEMIYPTGEKQKKRTPKWEKYYEWADVVAGDFHVLHRFMPDNMKGKVILTNTVTAKNEEEMKELGVSSLITTTPEFEGRSFGTNVMEGVYSTILGKTRENPPTIEEFRSLLRDMDIKPRIKELN